MDKDIENLEEQVDLLEPTVEDFIGRRINHLPFAKLILWLNLQSRKSDFIYLKEFAKFMKFSNSYGFNTLNQLANVGILEKKYTGNVIEYHFVKNGDNPIIWKYLDKAKKTLGLI